MLYFRLIYVVLLIIIIIGGNYSLLFYAAVMVASIEYLNRQKAFKNLPNYGIFNVIFVSYLVFIVLNRSRNFKFGVYTEGSLNIAEHGFFALIICSKLLLYFHLFSKYALKTKAIFAFISFNLIGLFNEIFQNQLNHRPLFLFIEDARKDMIVNGLGSLLFLIILALNHFYFLRIKQLIK
jgi:hypothetical protein